MKEKVKKIYKVLLVEAFAKQSMPMMRYLKKFGCIVYTLNSSVLDLGYTSHYPNKKLLRKDWDIDSIEKSYLILLEIVKKYEFDVIIPLTDFSAKIMSKFKNELERYTKCAVNDWNVFENAMNKQKTMEICQNNNIPCPFTINNVNSVEEVLTSGIEYPFIIKPQVGFGSIGFRKINNEKELREYLPIAIEKFGGVVVQDYIPQTCNQYQVELFFDYEGIVKSAIATNKTRWYPVDGGSICCGSTIDKPEVIEYCIKLMKIMGWVGYADIDLIEDPRDHKLKIMEINPRITASVKLCFFAGVNFAQQIVELYTDQSVTEYLNYVRGKKMRFMHTDILWFIKSPNRFKAKPSWFNFFNFTDLIFSIYDPLPWLFYSIQMLFKAPKEMKKRSRK